MKDTYSLKRSIIKTSARLHDKPVLLPEHINVVINVQTHAQAKCRQQANVHTEKQIRRGLRLWFTLTRGTKYVHTQTLQLIPYYFCFQCCGYNKSWITSNSILEKCFTPLYLRKLFTVMQGLWRCNVDQWRSSLRRPRRPRRLSLWHKNFLLLKMLMFKPLFNVLIVAYKVVV